MRAHVFKACLALCMVVIMGAALQERFPIHRPTTIFREGGRIYAPMVIRTLSPVVDAELRAMGVSRRHLLEWRDRHPTAALRHLWSMEEEDQRTCARIARYILRQNRAITPELAWVEAAALVHYSAKYGAPVELAVAVANTESHFSPESLSSYGAMGVMQVVWRIHHGLLQANGILSGEELHNPDRGIAAGCLLLGRYLRAEGDTREALGRYAGGSVEAYCGKVEGYVDRFRRLVAEAGNPRGM